LRVSAVAVTEVSGEDLGLICRSMFDGEVDYLCPAGVKGGRHCRGGM
jgi:hypothetical protein